MLASLTHAPQDNTGVQGAACNNLRIRTPSNTINPSIMEAPFDLIVFFQIRDGVHDYLKFVKNKSIVEASNINIKKLHSESFMLFLLKTSLNQNISTVL